MKFDNRSPIYMQVVNDIKKEIVSGTISPGDKLPSSRELALKYVINPNTAARIYQVLEQEGLTYTKRGLGTYVMDDNSIVETLKKEMAKGYVISFLKDMNDLGMTQEEIITYLKEESSHVTNE